MVNHYRFSYAMRHSDARGLGGGGGAITDDVLKFRKDIEFESSCTVTCFSHIYLIID